MAAGTVDVCAEYGVALAVEDFVPCILAAAALVVLVQAVRARVPQTFLPAAVGAVLIAVGGLSKASWKLLVASGCWEYPILEQVLFPFISFGFAAMAWAILSASKGNVVVGWPFALIPVACSVVAVVVGNMLPLLASAAIGATFFGVTAATVAFRAGKRSVGWVFVVYVLGTNILPPLGAQPNQTAALQWAEQLTNSSIQLLFLLGCLWLREHFKNQPTENPVAEEKAGVPA
ncbi:hypothetical protein [Nocardioides yefusunii]|uniref:DUF4203 domain-containing protein n=1 Tax=Nocardioides yefusunii TaxID=2500546 RepID=A0ABW1QSB8_9ACTN|nr:hypothetical protein [Nocardioides yefusunii]